MESTKLKGEIKAKAEDLIKEILEVVADTFVATYEVEKNSIIMRIPNGQLFCIAVNEITE